jgi:hypothetical protein
MPVISLPGEIADFVPHVAENREAGFTEMILRDCLTVWRPLVQNGPHHVDLGYDRHGALVGIRIWELVASTPQDGSET